MSIFNRFHALGGIIIAPLIFVACITGFLYALSPTIEQHIYSQELTASDAPAKPLEEQVAAAAKVHPNLDIYGVRTTGDPTDTTQVLFSDESLGSTSYRHAVFVDPGTLNITGDMIQYGSSGALPFRTWLSNGHRSLWLGTPGRAYMEIAASWLAPLAISGLFMWWSTRKQRSSRKAKAGTRRRLVKHHTTIGVWMAIGMLFLGASGLTWSLVAGENIATVREQLNWTTPKIDTAATQPNTTSPAPTPASDTQQATGHEHHDHTQQIPNSATNTTEHPWSGIDTVEHIARSHGLTGQLELQPPTNNGDSWSASEMRQAYRMGTDALAINPETQEITSSLNFADWPLAAKLTAWAIQLHMGYLFGIVSEIALAALALGLMILIILGYRMWFKRGRGNKPGALPRPFDWSQHSIGVKVLLLAMLAVYCVIAPLFAVSACVLLIMDWALRMVKHTRQTQHDSSQHPSEQNTSDEQDEEAQHTREAQHANP